jgi:acetoacetate decarboxylase
LPVCEGEELAELAPVRCGNGYRMSVSYSVTDLKTLVDHSAK